MPASEIPRTVIEFVDKAPLARGPHVPYRVRINGDDLAPAALIASVSATIRRETTVTITLPAEIVELRTNPRTAVSVLGHEVLVAQGGYLPSLDGKTIQLTLLPTEIHFTTEPKE